MNWLERNQSHCGLISSTKVAAPCWSRRLERFGFGIHQLWFRYSLHHSLNQQSMCQHLSRAVESWLFHARNRYFATMKAGVLSPRAFSGTEQRISDTVARYRLCAVAERLSCRNLRISYPAVAPRAEAIFWKSFCQGNDSGRCATMRRTELTRRAPSFYNRSRSVQTCALASVVSSAFKRISCNSTQAAAAISTRS